MLVPQKDPTRAKSRFTDPRREEVLAKGFAHVKQLFETMYTVLVTDDEADSRYGFSAQLHPKTGTLNGDLHASAQWAKDGGAKWCVVVPTDLCRLDHIEPYLTLHPRHPLITPDQRLDGTSLLRVPLDPHPRFQYGPRSFMKHLKDYSPGIEILGIPTAMDFDTPADLTLCTEVFDLVKVVPVQVHDK